MSVTAPRGFRAAGVAAGVGAAPNAGTTAQTAAGPHPGTVAKGRRDVAIVINDGPARAAGAVFSDHPDPAAPSLWSRQVVSGGRVRAAVLNAGCANAGTGSLGCQDAHAQAEHAAALLADTAAEIVLCSAGPIGVRPPLEALEDGLARAITEAGRGGALPAADAIRTNDTVAKIAFRRACGITVGGMAKGPDPSLGSVLCVLTTDADLAPEQCQTLVSEVASTTFKPLTGTNDAVLLMASGAVPGPPDEATVHALLTRVCAELAAQIEADPPTTEDKQVIA